MVKEITKFFLSMLCWMCFIIGVYGGSTLFVAWMLNPVR